MPMTGVAGWPVAHSRSPALHSAGFEAIGAEGWTSQLLPIPPDLFVETVRALPESGFAGINVTIPHKVAAYDLADLVSDEARACGAANTLTFREGEILADNTDVWAIETATLDIISELGAVDSALLLGAGGSARAAIVGLKAAAVKNISVWNRTFDRAVEICNELGGQPVVEAVDAQLIVNTTSLGLSDATAVDLEGFPFVDGFPDSADALIDLVYRTGGTPLVQAAAGKGAAVIDGLEILVRQGAASIGIWTGTQPPFEPLRQAVGRLL